MRWWSGVLCCALVAMGLGPAVPAAGAPGGSDADPVRILLVGDSVTQGSSGDFTWRYRLWEHFAEAGVAVDFVGPREDLWDGADRPGSSAYADPDFDRDHAARWGMQVEVMDVPIAELVADYRPDVVVEMLGVTDLLFGWRSAGQVAARIGRFVDEARSVDPGVDVVLAEATQHWFSGVPELNALLDGVAAAASVPDAPVVVAETATAYDALEDTWDHSHPNARGEMRISWAVADALHAVGVGEPADRTRPLPLVGLRRPAELGATAGDGSATLDWTGPPGSTAHFVWSRDATTGEPWARLPFPVPGESWTAGMLTNGHRYEFRLQSVKGDDEPEVGVFSNTVQVVPAPPAPPPLAAPAGLRGTAGPRCVALTWQSSPLAGGYQVQLRHDGRWRTLGRTSRTRFVAVGLPPTRTWTLRVRAWADGVPGAAATVRLRRPGPHAAPCR